MPSPPKSHSMISAAEFRRRLNVSRSTFWRLKRDERFPKPLKISDRCERWTENMFAAYLASLEANDERN